MAELFIYDASGHIDTLATIKHIIQRDAEIEALSKEDEQK